MSGEREDAGSSRLQPTPVAPSRGGEGEELSKAIAHLAELAEGWDCAALCEDAIVWRFQAELDAFVELPPNEGVNLRHVRAAVDAKSAARAYRKDAAAVRAVLRQIDSEATTPPPPDPQVPDDRSRDDIEPKPGDVT